MDIPTIACETVDDVFRELNARYPGKWHPEFRPHLPPWLFRGHAIADWKLIASFHRRFVKPEGEFATIARNVLAAHGFSVRETDAIELDPMQWSEKIRTAFYNLGSQKLNSLARDFIDLAGEVGLLHGAPAAEATSFFNRHWNAEHIKLAGGAPGIEGLCQHHGIPTEYLDWTRDSYVALWMACRELHTRFFKDGDWTPSNGFGMLWAIPRNLLLRLDRIRIRVLYDQAFPHAQGGFFTYDGEAESDFIRTGSIPSLDSLLQVHPNENEWPAFKLLFPHKIAPALLRRLRLLGVTSAHLMPTLTNVGKVVMDINEP